jgi:hypothetical protein
VFAAALATAACGHNAARTRLKISVVDSLANVHVFHLRCDPAGGDVRRAARVCAELAGKPRLVENSPDTSMCGQQLGPTVDVSGVDGDRKVAARFGCDRAVHRMHWLELLRFSDIGPELAVIRTCCPNERPPGCEPKPPRAVLDAAAVLERNTLAPVRAAFWVSGRHHEIERVLSGAGIPENQRVFAVLVVGRFRFVASCPVTASCPSEARLLEVVVDARTGRTLDGGGGSGLLPDLNRLAPVHDLLPYLDGRCSTRS